MLVIHDKYQQLSGVLLVGEIDSLLFHCSYGYADQEWHNIMPLNGKFTIESTSKQFTGLLILKFIELALSSYTRAYELRQLEPIKEAILRMEDVHADK